MTSLQIQNIYREGYLAKIKHIRFVCNLTSELRDTVEMVTVLSPCHHSGQCRCLWVSHVHRANVCVYDQQFVIVHSKYTDQCLVAVKIEFHLSEHLCSDVFRCSS